MRIWKMTKDSVFKCVAVGMGHTHAVAAVAWSRYDTGAFWPK